MLSSQETIRELSAYRLKLLVLGDRFATGERTTVGAEALSAADALTCLLEEAPPEHAGAVDYLIDRYEALRARCLA